MRKIFTPQDLDRYFKEAGMLRQGDRPDGYEAMGPGPDVIRNILNYSRSLEVFRTRMIGAAFLLMN